MKYLSENGKQYDTEKEAREADEKFLQAQNEEESKKALVSKAKKDASDKIKSANEKVKQAESEYDKAKEEAAVLLNEANKQAEELLKAALKRVDKAREERMLAIKEFNEKFGDYVVKYTDTEAEKEYERFISDLRKRWGGFFPFWF